MNKNRKPGFILLFIIGILLVNGFMGRVLTGEPLDLSVNGKIIIFHINDTHARIDNFAKIARYVEQERKNNPNAAVFFFNAGDNCSGNPFVDQATPKGEPLRQLMYLMGFDAMTLGNHEFDYGQEFLINFIKGANFPIVSANIKVNKGPFPQPKPFTILKTKNGIKLAILGLIQVDKETNLPSTNPANLGGIQFLNPLETAVKYKNLKAENHVFIALSHLGADTDETLAKEMKELDVIVGGHSHTTIKTPGQVNGVLIAQAGDNAGFVGRIELTIQNGRIVKKSGKLIPAESITGENPVLKKMIAKYNDNPVLNAVITTLPRAVKGKMELGHLISDAIRKICGVDIAFHNGGGIRGTHLKKIVQVKDILTILPFSNEIVMIEMTPGEIRSLLSFDFQKYRGLDMRISGFQCLITSTRSYKVKAIEMKDLKGILLNEKKTYKVGLNNYMAASYIFEHKDPGKSLKIFLSDALIRYLKENKDAVKGIESRRSYETIESSDKMTKIGKTDVDISSGSNRFAGSSPSGNLIADALRSVLKVDIATFPTASLDPDMLVRAHSDFFQEYIPRLYKFCKKNKPVTGRILGRDLKKFFFQRAKYKKNADLQVSGLNYTVNIGADGKVSSVDCYLSNGKAISDTREYFISLNDFEYKKHYKLDSVLKRPTEITQTNEEIAALYINKIKTVTGSINEQRIAIKKK